MLLGRPVLKCEDNIRMDFEEVGIEWMNWIQLVEDRDQLRASLKETLNLRIAKTRVI